MSQKPLKVIAGAPDRPLVIGDIEIDCYVLEDKTRALTQRGVFRGIGATRGGQRSETDGAQIPRFATQKWLKPFIPKELVMALKSPILFLLPNGRTAYGYPATILVAICNTILDAHSAGATTDRQTQLVNRATVFIRSLAGVAIIALVDEATGYQQIREQRALATILEEFIATELQPWKKTYPYGFYLEICHLRKWPIEYALKRPKIVGRWTDDMIYARIAPGVLGELRELNPMLSDGVRKWRHHQWFRPDPGYIKLNQHIAAVRALMRASANWGVFQRSLKRAFPKLRDQGELNLDDNH